MVDIDIFYLNDNGYAFDHERITVSSTLNAHEIDRSVHQHAAAHHPIGDCGRIRYEPVCGFCDNGRKAVGNAADWSTGTDSGPVACPRCGKTQAEYGR